MLTLFTGAPGAGKGMAGVELVRQLVSTGRPLFVLEVPEPNVEPVSLALPHTLLGPGEVERWQELVPDGAVVYAPEAQRIWPARPPSAKTPAHAEAVGQHRHRGIDMVLDTQAPKLIDDKVRLRVGRHIHLRDLGVLGRHWYEWPELGNIERWKNATIKKRFRMGKGVQDLYKSATSHIKPVRGFPPSLYVLAVGLVILAVIVGRFAYRWISTGSLASPGATAASPAASAAPGVSPARVVAPGRPHERSFPSYSSVPVVPGREPYESRALQLEGQYSIGAQSFVLFGMLVDGKRITTVKLPELLRAGYVWQSLGPCAGLLRFGEVERLITCAPPSVVATGPSERSTEPRRAPGSIFGTGSADSSP